MVITVSRKSENVMNRVHFARNFLTYWVPGLLGMSLLLAGIVFGVKETQHLIVYLINYLGGKLICFAVILLYGVYIIIMSNTFDPFWPIRKRLWAKGAFFILDDDNKDRAEPFIWSRTPLPESVDITDLM